MTKIKTFRHDTADGPRRTEFALRHRERLLKGSSHAEPLAPGLGGYSILPKVWEYLALTSVQRLVLYALFARQNHEHPGQGFYAGYTELKNATGIKSTNTLKKTLDSLIAKGFIDRKAPEGAQYKSRFWVHYDLITNEAEMNAVGVALLRQLKDEYEPVTEDIQDEADAQALAKFRANKGTDSTYWKKAS